MSSNSTRSDADPIRRIAGWSIARVARAAGGRLVGDLGAQLCPRAVSTDTRSLHRGDLFVALRGEHFDGHDFVDEAVRQGAAMAMVDRAESVPDDLSAIVVEDTLAGLAALGKAVWREATDEGLHTIDVTGSNGKTTVKEMLALLWDPYGRVHATPGNLNNHIGVPLVLCGIPADCDHLVVEMGANAPGDVSELIEMAPGSERIITSIGLAHLDGFGSVDGIRRAKSEIFERGGADMTAVVPFSEVDHLIGEDFGGRVVTVGFDRSADITVEVGSSQPAGPGPAKYSHGGRVWNLQVPLPGSHHALNVATALATLVARGLVPTEDECNTQLAKLALPDGRWRVVDVGDIRFVDDAYNANPSSMAASFDAFMATADPAGRPRIAILGEMLELGGDAARWHCEVARTIGAAAELDAVGMVGAFGEAMAEAAEEEAGPSTDVRAFQTVGQVGDWLDGRGEAFVFLKASRGAHLEGVIDRVKVSFER